MKAILQNQYGGPEVLKLSEVEKPVPKGNEILVKIHTASVTAAHCAMRKGKPLFGRLIIGLTKPKMSIPGTDLAGEIEEVGINVTKFKPGDKIFAATDIGGGCYAQFTCLSESSIIAHIPANSNYDEASSAIEGGLTALPFLRDSGKISFGKSVLINGASGSVGTAAVQFAKYFGAEVTAVCGPSNVEMVKSLGADLVVDYTKADFTKGDKKYDIVFDTVGKTSFGACKNILKEDGRFLSTVLNLTILGQMLRTSLVGKKKAVFSATGLIKPEEKIKDLIFLKDLIDAGNFTSVIDKKYKLEEIAEAHKYVEAGHKKGNVILNP